MRLLTIRRLASSAASALALVIGGASVGSAQDKGQWLLGSYGLNAGTFPAPGFTYSNLTWNYAAGQFDNGHGSAILAITGTYSYWLNLNQFQYVVNHKVLGGYYKPYVDVILADGAAVAHITGTNLAVNNGGSGLSDTFIVPVAFGWHLPHADVSTAYAITAPTGRFSEGASNNVGSGYWGNNFLFGATGYLTKNRGTTANVFVSWEGHGAKKDTQIVPGQALSLEWGIGQVIPLEKDMTQLVQVGLIGYDQWRVSPNSGEMILAAYVVHAAGAQVTYLLPPTNAAFFLKFYDEFSARARTKGYTLVLGASWTRAARHPVQ